jgi:hypothetical protein
MPHCSGAGHFRNRFRDFLKFADRRAGIAPMDATFVTPV